MHLNYKGNEYADVLGRLADRMPKTVLAAVAVSFANVLQGEHIGLESTPDYIALEWVTLFENGIIPQRPPQYVKEMAARAKEAK